MQLQTNLIVFTISDVSDVTEVELSSEPEFTHSADISTVPLGFFNLFRYSGKVHL